MNPIYVAGVGMVPFKKPGTSEAYDVMGAQAVQQALDDAGLAYTDVQQAYAGYVYGDSTAGQKALYGVGKDLAVEDKWPNWYEGNPFKAARDTMMKAEPAKQ